MSKLRRWLTGAAVMKRLDISRLDLLELVKGGRLPAHGQLTGELVEIGNGPASFLPHDSFAGPPIKRVPGGYTFVREHEARIDQVSPEEIEGCAFLIADMEALKKSQPEAKTRNKAMWDRVREKAAELWESDSTITLADMVLREEITLITGKLYAEKTIRRYINDLCPNHNPGRRPSKK
jgi:hypothetical protein